MYALPVSDNTWNREVLQSDVPVLVEITAHWCASADATRRAVDQIAGETPGRLTVLRLELDTNPLIARRYAITSIPTILMIERGRVVRRLVGARNLPTLREEFGEYLS